MTLENIDFTITTNSSILIILLILSLGYSYFIYRYTIPKTSTFVKSILIGLRSLALFLVIAILFEPALNLSYLQKNEPINILLIDNSSSIVNKDSTNRSNKINNFIIDYKNMVSSNIQIATFGKEPELVNSKKEIALNFQDPITNYEKLAPFVQEQKENIATITILSDGIITDGSNSTIEIEKLNIPVFTIAIGDTTKPFDIEIKKVEFNKLIYLNNTTEITGIISNQNFGNKNVIISLINTSGVVEQKQIKLHDSGVNNISFFYKPTEIGKQNLRLTVSQLNEEETYANNKYPFVIDVLNDKTNVIIIAGAPSADLSFMSQSLVRNDKIKLNKIVQIAESKFLDNKFSSKIDSADVIFMLDFPTSKTPTNLLKTVSDNINLKNTPYFLILSELTDYKKLNTFDKLLPFNIKSILPGYSLVQPKIISGGNGIIKNLSYWSNLAPIKMNSSRIDTKIGSSLLATSGTRIGQNESPLLFTSKVGSSRNIVFNGFNFWKWQLQSDDRLENLFDAFLSNSIK
ncbi:MAG: hypothetical protein PF445_13120, partial [Melioribacteraceae bacterium]|nr:hypothetical protein [Melioribacteraceae bacterium]